jgi:hypothetical protein
MSRNYYYFVGIIIKKRNTMLTLGTVGLK